MSQQQKALGGSFHGTVEGVGRHTHELEVRIGLNAIHGGQLPRIPVRLRLLSVAAEYDSCRG